MALELTKTADSLINQTNVDQQIILEIDGFDFIFGSSPILKIWNIGDAGILIGDPGLLIGGTIEDPNSRAFISLDGTTNNIQQQLDIEKGGVGSISKFNISMVDKGNELTEIFTPGNTVDDMLAREADIFINLQGSSHPENSIRIFNGIIDRQQGGQGFWRLEIAHPETLKNQDLFVEVNTNLDGAITDSDTTLTLNTTNNLIEPQDAVTTFVRIDDEIIQYSAISSNDLTGLTRGALGTTAVAHDDDVEVISFYRLQGEPLTLALKIMLSTKLGYYITDVDVPRFVQVDPLTSINNSFLIEDLRFQEDNNVRIGDLVTTTGATNGANNFTDRSITNIQKISTGTVITVDGAALVSEIGSGATATLKSQYDTLPVGAGCNMKPKQVDVEQHEFFDDTFPTNIIDYDFYIKETTNAKEFITEQIYRPAGYIQMPRKARASVNITKPPLAFEDLKQLTNESVTNAKDLRMLRSINRNFFNSVVYRFEESALEDMFLAGEIIESAKSNNRIPTGVKSLSIDAKGLRDNSTTRDFIARRAREFNDRFQFAAESVVVRTNYKTGFSIEIGDSVLFGENLQAPDITKGDRNFTPRVMECINKTLNLKTGKNEFVLLDTGFGNDGRFGVISPSSFIDSGSTTTIVYIKKSFDTGEFEIEREKKWRTFIGDNIRIHNDDFTFDETVKLLRFDESSSSGLIVDPALSLAPSENYLVDLAEYPTSTDSTFLARMKALHCFWDPQVEVTGSVSTTVFEVGAGDINKFFVGSFVRIHSPDFSDDSTPGVNDDDPQVVDVDTGLNRVTIDTILSFTPAPGDLVDLIGFADQGNAYRLI